MIKFHYLVYAFLMFYGVYSQNAVIKEGICKSKLDSIISKSSGESFFKKNIKFNDKTSFIDTYFIIDSVSEYKRIFINFDNTETIKNSKNGTTFSSDFYNYVFSYEGCPFHERIYTCEFLTMKNQVQYEIIQILTYYEKIKNKIYISPKSVKKIAKSQGIKKICYQSLTPIISRDNGKIVWQVKECKNAYIIKVLDIDPETGKILNYNERNYTDIEKAMYWCKISQIRA